MGMELLPRLFKTVLSQNRRRAALFAADLKTREKGWVHVRLDALDPEEISVSRWTQWGAAIRPDIWLSFPAADRSASEAFRDPLAKEDFRIRSYSIEAAVTGSAELHATTKVSLEHRVAGERVLLFELDANLRVESVQEAGGAALPFFQPKDPKDRVQSFGDYVAVVLPQPARAGQTQVLEFRYGGKRVIRKVGNGNFFCQSYGWYPTRPNSFAFRADFEMYFRSPKKYTLVATGNKVEESTDGDLALSTWKSDLPLAVAGFAFGDYKLYAEKAGSVDVEVYANRQPDDFLTAIQQAFQSPLPGQQAQTPLGAIGNLSPAALVKVISAETANTIRLFERFFGPYPYKRVAVTNIPYSYGQGWPTLIYLSALSFLDSTQRHTLGLRDQIQITDFFRAHESSHQWWGHGVGWKSYHDQWLSEGFAQFSGNLYVQFRRDLNEYLTRLRQDKRELMDHDLRNRPYESLGPVWMGRRLSSSEAPRAYAVVVYNKGGYVLHMLRMLFWDPTSKDPEGAFIAMMHDFCQTFHNQPASTEDFKAMAEKHMPPSLDVEGNGRLDWFFRQYVYGTGIPEYRFRYTVQEAGQGKWKLAGNVAQSGVPEGWKDVLPLYLHQSGKVLRLGFLTVGQKETPFEVALPFKPDKVSLNDYEDTLAEIRQ